MNSSSELWDSFISVASEHGFTIKNRMIFVFFFRLCRLFYLPLSHDAAQRA